jgi:quercetin dioxygenase-like cupin family protein
MTVVGTIGLPRRIVTGLREDGVSTFSRVEEVEQVDYPSTYPGLADDPERPIEIHRMWAIDSLPLTLPVDGLTPPIDASPSPEETPEALRRTSPQPRAGGVRATLIKYRPGIHKPPRLHWHDTFDLQWLIAGELVTIMDDGNEVVMRPGDLVVQHGTNHAWEARGEEGAVLALVQLGVEREGVRPPEEGFQDHSPEGLAKKHGWV